MSQGRRRRRYRLGLCTTRGDGSGNTTLLHWLRRCRWQGSRSVRIRTSLFELLASRGIERLQDSETTIRPKVMEDPECLTTRCLYGWIHIGQCLSYHLIQHLQTPSILDHCLIPLLAMHLHILFDMTRPVNPCLNGLFLERVPQKGKEYTRISRCVGDESSHHCLRFLSSDFLRKTGHFEEVGQKEFAEWIQSSSQSERKFGIK